MTHRLALVGFGLFATILVANPAGQGPIVRVDLAYRNGADGPRPNFSPKGTQVPLVAVAETVALPAGAARPAKVGTIKVGSDQRSWIPVLATANAGHSRDLCQLFLDRNKNGNFADDGPALVAEPKQNDKTKAWWSSMDKVELSVPYGSAKSVEPYLVNFWIVRDDAAEAPDVLRYSVGSWRYGTAKIAGIDALVAAMDADNNAMFDKNDMWSVLQASAPDAAKAVLSINEARQTGRFMFLQDGSREVVLEFRGFSPDGRSLDLAVVDRPVTKAADRKADDTVAEERSRPRAKAPFAWGHDFDAALAQAKTAGRKVFVDFETTWCGPCKTMDEWIYTDAEVAAQLNAGYVGVKLDGDIEKALVKRFKVAAYPTMIVLDGAGTESWRAVGYQSSKEMLALLNAKSQSHATFVGALEPQLAPGRLATSVSLSPAPDDARAKVAALLSVDEKLWIGELTVGGNKQPLYVVESGGEVAAVMTDVNANGAIEPNERIAFAKVDEKPVVLTATMRIATKGAAFPNYPVRVGMNRAAIAPQADRGAAPPQFYLMTSYQAFAVGSVTVDGKPLKVQLIANAKDFTINPAKSYQYVDCNGDGELDTDMTSWEMGYGSGEPVVFHIGSGDRYVSIGRVDPAAKTITLVARTAAEYQRIELRVGSTLPDFAFTAMDGSKRHLADFRGKHLIIDFWGTWCGPCVGEIPFLKKAYETYKDKGFEILGMDNELPDVTPEDFTKGLAKVRAFIAERGITWTQAQTESIKPLYTTRFQIVAWPTVILLDPAGVIVSVDRTSRGEPGLRGDQLDKTLAAVFKGK